MNKPTPALLSDQPGQGTMTEDWASENHPFDEAYFEDGASRGTEYSDYLANALLNRFYFEIAKAVSHCFAPKRVLEVGCAAGPTIYHLDYLEVEAVGIDASPWAVENRLSPNVIAGSVDQLEFPDDSFDLVFSVHMLEHVEGKRLDSVLSELGRVCSGVQMHLHPMIGTAPYVGDDFGHLVNLRKDKTHNLLKERYWWLDAWHKHGWHDTGLEIAFAQDNDYFEFSECQYILSRGEVLPELITRIARWNFDIARTYQSTLVGHTMPGHARFVRT